MDLKEAIAHAENKAGDCATDCKREHKQLAEWLHELLLLQEENAALKAELEGEKAAALNYRADAIEAEKQRDELQSKVDTLEDALRCCSGTAYMDYLHKCNHT